MTPSEPEPDTKESKEASAQRRPVTQSKWVLTAEALDKLLDRFSPNREEAGKRYEVMRVKLVRFFEWNACSSAEDLADESINRVARKIHDGQDIVNLTAFFLTVAGLVFLESLKPRNRNPVHLDEIPETAAEEHFEDEQKEERLRCLDQCMAKLTTENRTLILKYHHYEKRAKIDMRKQLADGLGIPLNALRIRAYRLRTLIEKCVRDCLAQPV